MPANALFGGPRLMLDNCAIIEDPDEGEWPYKMVYWAEGKDEPRGLWGARSKDGIHWDLDTPGYILKWGDRTNAIPHRDNGRYVILGRDPEEQRRHACSEPLDYCRVVNRIESDDFANWGNESVVHKPDLDDPPQMQIYSATAFRYESMYLGFLERMHMAPDLLDPELVFSHDGHDWQRTVPRPAFIERDARPAWDSDWISLPNTAPIRVGPELYFYYAGRTAAHACPRSVLQAGVGLASMRADGFCSLHATGYEGWFCTPTMTWGDGELCLNVDTRRDLTTHPRHAAGGAVRVEVCDGEHHPIDGFSYADCAPVSGNSFYAPDDSCTFPVTWTSGEKMASLAGKSIRLHFRIKEAHLYSFKVGGSPARPTGQSIV